MATSTVENYLKAILHLEDADTTISVGAIADSLAVTPGTVSAMMRHLSEKGLIDYVPRRSVALLPKGRRHALQVVRRHRLIETFLVQVMNLDWSEVHEEAEILEHVISDRLLARMDTMLGHPRHDPHGDPIPDDRGNVAGNEEFRPLAEIDSGRFRVVRVDDSEPAFLDWLRQRDLRPGREFELAEKDTVSGVLKISRSPGGPSIRIGDRAAAKILVELIA